MLKKDELYTNEISVAEANSIYSDENKVKILLIFTLFFMILIMGYFIYNSAKDNGNRAKGTRVLGVSYIPSKDSEVDKPTKNPTVQYNTKSNISNIDDKDEYEDIVMVDDKDKYTKIVIVKNPI
jgi:sensor histidine kinase regulating citrate/malate metabolism